MRILVTNDDGITSPGLRPLAEVLTSFGEVFVVAPDRDRSGAGHSLTMHRPLRIHSRGERWFAVDGTPTDCVNLAVKAILKDEPPVLVFSGINLGPNLGDDINYSGTVAAAMEGTLLGIPSVAISLAVLKDEQPNFVPAAQFVERMAKRVVASGLSSDYVININIPNLKNGAVIGGYEVTRIGKRKRSGAIAEKLDPRGKKYYWIGGDDLGFENRSQSDANAIRVGKVSITPIRLDRTHDDHLEGMREWKF